MTGIGALIGLAIGIILIICKLNPAYSLMLAALCGGLLGGLDLNTVVSQMLDGVKDMTPAIVRILAAGVLAGALVQTGSAEKIADSIIRGLGQKNVLLALILAVFFLVVAGVFIDVAVVTTAPIALAVGAKANLSVNSVLLAMIGGGKAGNIISPNPNTIAAAEKFGADLSSVMLANWIPALAGIGIAFLLSWFLAKRGEILTENSSLQIPNPTNSQTNSQVNSEREKLPNLFSALLGPAVALALLALRPLAGIAVDPLVALPVGGLVCLVATLKFKSFKAALDYGIAKMSGIAILLVGTGTLAGVVQKSTLKDMILEMMRFANLPEMTIAPVSGALMSAATASTTAGASVAAASFADSIMAAGITAVAGAAMINAGATVLDHLPHGSFFHATGGAVQMSLKNRLKLIPFESAVGFVLALASMCVNCLL